MDMKCYKKIMMMALLLALFSCAKVHEPGKGKIIFELVGDGYVEEVTKANVSDFTPLPSAGDFSLTLVNEFSTLAWSGLLSEWDPEMTFFEGAYTVTASYGNLEEEGEDKPYFFCSGEFNVVGGQTVNVQLNARLGNSIVRMATTEMFRSYYVDYSFSLTRDGVNVATFDNDNAVFVAGYRLKLEGVLKTETGQYEFEKELPALDAATAYTITIDAGNVGSTAIKVRFDNTLDTIQLGDIELND